MARLDPHSCNDDAQPETASLALKLAVDFASRTLAGEATLTFRAPGSGALDLDTRALAIESVEGLDGKALAWKVHPADPILGSRLAVTLSAGSKGVRIRYRTSPDASALQWLEPSQTAGKKHPFLFSQCQAIHARSVVPLQDTPRLRLGFTAELTIPKALKAVMAAAPGQRTEHGELAVERFEMPQPIPPYLLAFAVGDLTSKDLSPRSRVWAEPAVVEKAAWEFAGVEEMIRAAESLFGPYGWDRFDLLTMPPSFPYGGMENPRLTFLTPTLIAGDRSLVNVLGHELAHSWTGNLVTNANAEHFWLNEGFTVWAERRILEALEGTEVAALHAALGRRALDEAVEQFAKQPGLTKLRTELTGIDPDEAFSVVPYEKGYLFLRALEETAGREVFDGFVRGYLAKHAFQSVTTEDFVRMLREKLPGLMEKIGGDRWISGTGVPENAPRPRSSRLEAVEKVGATEPGEAAKTWGATEWQLYLERLPRPSPLPFLEALDARHGFSKSGNYEILVAWLLVAVSSGHAPATAGAEKVLCTVGRMKYLRPLFQALAKGEKTRVAARAIYEKAKGGYHPIARQVVEGQLKQHGA
jgi:aminopeptidase N